MLLSPSSFRPPWGNNSLTAARFLFLLLIGVRLIFATTYPDVDLHKVFEDPRRDQDRRSSSHHPSRPPYDPSHPVHGEDLQSVFDKVATVRSNDDPHHHPHSPVPEEDHISPLRRVGNLKDLPHLFAHEAYMTNPQSGMERQVATFFYWVGLEYTPDEHHDDDHDSAIPPENPGFTDAKWISPWHEIPLEADREVFHFVCEIPRGTTAKMEINKDIYGNPILQDFKVDARGNLGGLSAEFGGAGAGRGRSTRISRQVGGRSSVGSSFTKLLRPTG